MSIISYRLLRVMVLVFSSLLFTSFVHGQEMTPTIPPPRIVSATPDPSKLRGESGMAQADELLLKNAVGLSFSDGFSFTLNAQMVIETEEGSFALRMYGDGFIAGLDQPSDIQMQVLLNVNVDFDGNSADFVIEERIVNGIFYARGESLNDNRQTRWFGYPFINFIEDFINSFSIPGLPGFGTFTVGDAQEIDSFANLLNLESFITTRRVDIGGGNEAHFVTEFDIEDLLDSPEILSLVIQMLTTSGGIQLGDRSINTVADGFSLVRSFLVPDVGWSFDRFVDVNNQSLTRAEFDFDIELNIPTGHGLDITPVDIKIDAIFGLSGYGETYNVEIPPDAVVVDHLEDLETLNLLIPRR